jgi:putative membrane protein
VISCLGTASFLYSRGLVRLRARGHEVRTRDVAAYFAGIVSLAVALLSPLDRLSDLLFSAHMGQHEILILVAPPLLVLGKPFFVVPFGLPDRGRAAFVRLSNRRPARALFRVLTHPTVVVGAHAAILWIWHVPALFEAALADDRVHALQHLGFFLSAALFWWALIHGRYGRMGYGIAVLWVFATAAHSGALGALLTIAPKLWYPAYDAIGREWGVSPIEDQRLAGLLMWIPAGLLFTVLGLALFAAWLGEAARRRARWDVSP